MTSTHGCAYCTVCSTGVMGTLSPYTYMQTAPAFHFFVTGMMGVAQSLHSMFDRIPDATNEHCGILALYLDSAQFLLLFFQSVPKPSANNLSWVLSSSNNFLRPFPFQHSISCSVFPPYVTVVQFTLDSHRFERSRLKSACEVTEKADLACISIFSRKPDTSGVTQIIVFVLSYIV